jgi:hypothetical protein
MTPKHSRRFKIRRTRKGRQQRKREKKERDGEKKKRRTEVPLLPGQVART